MQKFIFSALFFAWTVLAQAEGHQQHHNTLLERTVVKSFINKMVEEHQFDAQLLKDWLSQVTIQSDVLTAIAKPAEKLPWHQYQGIFITPARIQEGVAFWHQYAPILAKAEKEYGVPAEMIIAIIGVESFYGKRAGKYPVFDSLVTLGFNYPPRAEFFLSELEQFLLLCREENWDPNQIKGSYAGAMGNPQFIASSYRRFAVDFNGNGKRDLLGNLDDSIGSVAHYFKENGWQPGGPIILQAQTKGDKFKPLIASKSNPKPEYTLQKMAPLGVKIASTRSAGKLKDQTFALVALQGKTGPEYWLGGQNFYVITRYNHSDHYAMAVYTLSQKIKAAHNSQLNTKGT